MKSLKLIAFVFCLIISSFANAEPEPSYTPSSVCPNGGDNIERCLGFYNFTSKRIKIIASPIQNADCVDHLERFNNNFIESTTVTDDNPGYYSTLGDNTDSDCDAGVEFKFYADGDLNELVGTVDYHIAGNHSDETAAVWNTSIIPGDGYTITTSDVQGGGNHYYETDIMPK